MVSYQPLTFLNETGTINDYLIPFEFNSSFSKFIITKDGINLLDTDFTYDSMTKNVHINVAPTCLKLVITRETDITIGATNFINSNDLTDSNLNRMAKQLLYRLQEVAAMADDYTLIASLINQAEALVETTITNTEACTEVKEIVEALKVACEEAQTATANSASNAAGSATTASNSASIANTKAGEAATSENNASTSMMNASNSASVANIKAGEAVASENNATNNASVATTKASEASNSATAASNSASIANIKAGEAAASAVIAQNAIKSNPNLLINGGFLIWQRGETFSMITNAFSADHWLTGTCSTTGTIKKNTDGNIQLDFTSDGQFQYLNKIEDFQHLLGKTVTMSVRIKTDTPIFMYIGTEIVVDSTNIIASNEWQEINIIGTVPMDSTHLEAVLSCSSISTGESIQIEWCKMELSSVATPFESLHYNIELLKCQYYYQHEVCFSCNKVGSVRNILIPFLTSMRVTPTVSGWRSEVDLSNNLTRRTVSQTTYNVAIVPTVTALFDDALVAYFDATTDYYYGGKVTLDAEL